MFPSTFRATLIGNLAVFTIEEAIIVIRLVKELRERAAADDKRAMSQLDKLKKRKSPASRFVK